MKLFLAPDYRNHFGLPSFGSNRIELWKSTADKLGAKYISFWARGREDQAYNENVGSTLPLVWLLKYITRGMAEHDPEVVLGMKSDDVLVFDYATLADPEYAKFAKTVIDTKIGRYSIVVPEHYKDGVSSITSFTFADLPPAGSNERAKLIMRAKVLASDISSDFLSDNEDISLEGAQLTAREITVLSLIADGKTYDEVGAALEISKWTVVAHVKNSKIKLNARNKSDVIAKAFNLGVI